MKRIALIGVAAIAAGCSQSPGTVPSGLPVPAAAVTSQAAAGRAPAAARAGVFVTQANGSSDGVVFGFKAQNKANLPPVCSIGSQNFEQTQIAADGAGNLYLPNVETSVIGVYSPNCGQLVRGIADPYSAPVDVAVRAGKIYAAGGTTVAVCTSDGCSSSLTDPSILQLETAAVDSKGNVWASYYSHTDAVQLAVWPRGKMPGHVVSGYVNQNTPGDLIFDKNDTLVSIQTLFTHAYIYRCSAKTASCSNIATFNLHGGSLYGALNPSNTNIQVTDYSKSAVDVYAYPSFAYEYSYSDGFMPGYSVQGIVQTR
ncbi:MAG: hypothetical protein WCD38_02075 [Candidatus Tumulicola sp.]